MGSHRIATRYAKSLLQMAVERGELESAASDIKSIDNAFEQSAELRMLFKSPIINPDKKLAIAEKLFKGKSSNLVYSFIELLIKKGRESHFHEVVNAFVAQYNELKGVTPVKLITAVKMDSGLVQTIVSNLKAKEFLKEVELHEEVDESLLGGFILQYGDKMIDSSVRRRLNELHTLIEDNSYVKKYS